MQQDLGGDFYGAVTTPIRFAVNPRKSLFRLAEAAERAGVRLFQNARVIEITRTGTGFELKIERSRVQAKTVLIATDGYSSENLPGMRGRYMPAQSNVIVTRPLTDAELSAQGWTSAQMAYDSRHLLHYFRLMADPGSPISFGLRGGLTSSPRAEAAARRMARRDFETLFPTWADAESTHARSVMVCLMLVPFLGESGVFAAFAYHGNGFAMASFSGYALAQLALGRDTGLPQPMSTPPGRFPLDRFRRWLMPPAYAGYWVQDR